MNMQANIWANRSPDKITKKKKRTKKLQKTKLPELKKPEDPPAKTAPRSGPGLQKKTTKGNHKGKPVNTYGLLQKTIGVRYIKKY